MATIEKLKPDEPDEPEVSHEKPQGASGQAGATVTTVQTSGGLSDIDRHLDMATDRQIDLRMVTELAIEQTGQGANPEPANVIDNDPATVGKDDGANVGKPPLPTLAYDPFANVGKVLKMPNLPRLADTPKPFQLNDLKWYKPDHKPPAPKGFYWQGSGSKTEKVGKRKKKIYAGWLLIKSGNCQGCGERYRPPIIYLKGSAWATLQGESYGRQCAEIKLMLGKSRGRLHDLRCPKCSEGHHGQISGIDETFRSRGR